MTEYRVRSAQVLTSKLTCPDFETLAYQLASIIFDTSLDERRLRLFGDWIAGNAAAPEISIPQTVTLYEKSFNYA